MGGPRDVEWVMEGSGSLHLLQARPITALSPFGDWEAVHEFDSPVLGAHELLTTHNVG